MTTGSRWDSVAPIRYPDPNIVALDRRFASIMLGHAAIERTADGVGLPKGRCGSAIRANCSSATYRTTASCRG